MTEMHATFNVDQALIEELTGLDSQTLSKLRRCAGMDPWNPDVLKVVAPFLPTVEGWQREVELTRLAAIATLYAAHAANRTRKAPCVTGTTLASVMARVAAKGDSHASVMDRTMRQIAYSDTVETLWRGPLVRAVQRIASEGLGIDWFRLARDLSAWRDPAKRIQKNWATDYWGSRRAS